MAVRLDSQPVEHAELADAERDDLESRARQFAAQVVAAAERQPGLGLDACGRISDENVLIGALQGSVEKGREAVVAAAEPYSAAVAS